MNPTQHILVLALRVYRAVISPLKVAVLGPAARCRFTPSCSAYALEAVQRHGAIGGLWLAARRVGRCHPWGGCGHDPVPASRSPCGVPHAPRSEDKPVASLSSPTPRASVPWPSLST